MRDPRQEINRDTHNPAIQASAARLIRLLHQRYPGITPLLSLPPDPSDKEKKAFKFAQRSQGSLLEFIKFLLEKPDASTPLPTKVEQLLNNPHIGSTVEVLLRILGIPEATLSEQNKRLVFEQAQFIASIYPGGQWGPNDIQWSTNKYSDATTGKTETLCTSPAETLNLFCRALLDNVQYVSQPGKEDKDLTDRISNFYTHLHELNINARRRQKQVCAAGQQHDLLYLLNHVYLDDARKPIELLVDTDDFFQECVYEFVVSQINERLDEEKNKLVLSWLHWQNLGINAEGENPIVVFLRENFPVTKSESESEGKSVDPDIKWKNICEQYVKRRCEAFGLDVRSDGAIEKMRGYVQGISHMNVPLQVQSSEIRLFFQIEATSPIPLPTPASPMYGLIHTRNIALAAFKKKAEPGVVIGDGPDLSGEFLQSFWDMIVGVDSLFRYSDLAYLQIGEEDRNFHQACQEYRAFLLGYLAAYLGATEGTADQKAQCSVLLPSIIQRFDEAHQKYQAAAQPFKQHNHIDFIENYFALIDMKQNNSEAIRVAWDKNWSRLQGLQASGTQIILTDHEIQGFFEHVNIEGGMQVLEVTPYMITRVLLTGLSTDITTWSRIYSQTLQLVTGWLMEAQSSANERLKAFSQSYSPAFLANLYFMASVASNPELATIVKNEIAVFERERERWHPYRCWGDNLFYRIFKLDSLTADQRTQIWNAVEGKLGEMIQNRWGLKYLFTLLPEHLTSAQRSQILNAVEGKLGEMISDGYQLKDLFSLSFDQLTPAQRDQILNTLQGKLVEIIQNGMQLKELFALTPETLTPAQRSQILNAVEGKLGEMIQNRWELKYLFTLLPEHLTSAQRSQILNAVEGKLGEMISDGYQLKDLFSLSFDQLTPAQRDQILNTLQGKLVEIIQNGVQLKELFALTPETLTPAQRSQIFNALEGKLGEMIRDGYQLKDLFALLLDQLTSVQRDKILDALEGKWGKMIKNGVQLKNLLALPLEQVTPAQRTQILTAIQGDLGGMIQNEYQLKELFALPLEKLTLLQRDKILDALEGKLVEIIQNGVQLKYLFTLLPEHLTSAQRTQILTAIQGKLVDMVKSGYSLKDLLALPLEQVTPAQRTQILTAIQGDLGGMIQNEYQLKELFALPLEKLTLLQRDKILDALEGKLVEIIQNGVQLKYLFTLLPEHLTSAQRTQILTAIQGKLGGMIQNEYQLKELFALPLEKLTLLQRDKILDAIKDKLVEIIQNGVQLKDLFALTPEQLTPAQRDQIFNALQGKLGEMIENEYQLKDLFSLSFDQLTPAQRDQILNEVNDKAWRREGTQTFIGLNHSVFSRPRTDFIISSAPDREWVLPPSLNS